MDQGPIERPPTPRWSMADTRHLLREVARAWVLAAVVAVAIAGLWSAAIDAPFVGRLVPSVLVVACLMPMSGYASRDIDASTKGWTDSATVGRVGAMYGDRTTSGLESTGLALFVSVPMVALALLLG